MSGIGSAASPNSPGNGAGTPLATTCWWPAMRPLGPSLFVSAALHVVAIVVLGIAITRSSTSLLPIKQPQRATAVPTEISRLIFIASSAPGGGGGGGGNRQNEPIRRAEAPGHDQLTLPVRRPILVSTEPSRPVEQAVAVVLDAKPLASGAILQAGLPTGGVSSGLSQGPGTGGGVGEGVGTGIGSGRGPGVGPGSGGGIGGGPYRPGGGVSAPRLLSEVRPTYTSDALARRIQGSVLIEMVVTREGLPSQIQVRRSLEQGLDNEAIKAVRQWRFAPGRLGQTPVDVWVVVVLDFTIR